MKGIFYLIFSGLLFLTACSEEDLSPENKLPLAVEKDFLQRFGDVAITSRNFFNGTNPKEIEINFTNKENNEASAYYIEGQWKLTITEIKDLSKLPDPVLSSFKSSPYGEISPQKIENIERVERSELAHQLYDIKFTYPVKDAENMYHELLFNEDGYMFPVFNYQLNEQRWFRCLEECQLEFIREHYSNADIRTFLNDMGNNSYLFLQSDTLKFIAFDNDNSWRKTTYRLSLDTAIPDQVQKHLKADDPNFHYTEIYYMESPTGNAYTFIDGNSDIRLGHIIGENI